MKLINLFGGPGCGKSSTAAGLFYHMKKAGHNVELVTEFAKDLVYLNHLENLYDQQEFIFAEQNNRMHRLRGKVDWAITDSPIILSPLYADSSYPCLTEFEDLVFATHNTYDNHNIFLERPTNYQQAGRMQTEEESKNIDCVVLAALNKNGITYSTVQTGPYTVEDILDLLRIDA